jgi:hypothetical protein
MLNIQETKWVIMSKDRTFIAKGQVRNRWLVPVDAPDKKRVLYYDTQRKAESAFNDYGFYGMRKGIELEAVKVEISIHEIVSKQ